MEQWTGSKLGKEYDKEAYCHSVCFTYMQSWVQLLSLVCLFVTPCSAACQASISITNSQSLLKFMSIESVMPSSHLILCHPILLLPSIIPSIRVFSNKSALCIMWPKYWSFNSSISPPNEYSGLIPLGFMGLISLQPKGFSKDFSNFAVQNINSLVFSFLYSPTLTSIHDYWKNHNFD